MFNSMKITAAKMAMNQFIDGIGTVQDLEIDKTTQSIHVRVNMLGEAEPISIQAIGLILGTDYMAVSHFACDKPWVEAALNRFLAGKEIKISEAVRSGLKMII
ncbi:MAG TPA: hypothetical protein PK843_08655 [bacterium]|nr:hypothetical protein [bacterium]HPN34571.1 hypothetical protein [bacterium]